MILSLLSLFGVATLTSQTAMDVSASLLVLYMLWKAFQWRQQDAPYSLYNSIGFDWIFPVWILVVALGVSLNSEWYESTTLRVLEFKWVIFFYIFSSSLLYRGLSSKVIWSVMAVVSICSIYAITIYFMGWDPLNPNDELSPTAGTVRTGGFFGNPMTMAHSYGIVLSLLFGLLLLAFRWRQKYRWPLLLTVALLAGAVLLTLTRGAWIAAVAASMVMTFLFSRRLFVVMILVWAVMIGGMYQFWPSFGERISGATEIHAGNSERLLYWKNNLEMWKDYPVLGIGIGENTERAAEYYQKMGIDPATVMISHAHNQYLNFLTGTGVLGLVCYLIFSGGFLWLSYRVWHAISHKDEFKKGLALGVLGAQVFFHMGSLTESNFEHSKIKYMMTLIWGILIWLAYESRVLRHKA